MPGAGVTGAAERFTTRDGTRLAFTRHGGAAGSARIVLVHPLAADREFWAPVAARLAERAAVVAIDCRGHGLSDKPAGPYTVELFARDLADLLDHLAWPSAAVAGTSMGGCVALAFAAASPRRLDALGLIDTTAWYGADAVPVWAERAERAIASGLAGMVAFQTDRWFGEAFRAAHPDAVERTVATFLRNDVAAYAESCRMLGACDLRASLSGISAPTAIIVGEEDYATPVAMAEALHRGIAGSSLAIIPGGRHLTPVEAPERVAAELARLLGPGAEARTR